MIDRRKLLAGMAVSAGMAASGTAIARAQSASESLHALLDRIFNEEVLSSPETLTALGLDTGPNAAMKARLDDRSAAYVARSRSRFLGHMEALSRIDRSALDARDSVYYDTVRFAGETSVIGYGFDYGSSGYPAPYLVSQLTGSYNAIPDFLDSQHSIASAEDAEAYLSRLSQFPQELDHETERMRADFARGATPPDFIIERTTGLIRNITEVAAAQSTMVESIVRRTGEQGIGGDWGARAERIVSEGVYPALERQIAAFEAIRPGASHDAGCWRLPDGEAYYDYGIRSYTTTTLSGAEIHQIGLEQVAEISARTDTLLRAQGMTTGTVGERLAAMMADERFLYPNTGAGREQLLADLNAQMADMQQRLPDYFGRIPRSPVEVRRVPEAIEAGAPGGYYQIPALDGSRPGAYYINLRNTAEWPRWTLPTLTYHEASPGHHHQLALQIENDDSPMLLKVMGFSAYSEGWALYAEQLADEMGVYESDPWGQIGYMQSFLFRAVRLVVDSGLHYGRWSREQAIRYMVDTLGDQESTVTTEVERYCVWPGQACSYKIGHTVWDRLRTEARTALGSRFDIRGFHDTGLAAGGIPLAVLERVMGEWVAAQGG
ncbi:MAG: DUF885 domain-containing protein [Brevundimonas sp.]|uniref:DUF885 domain-containing protein n=1 Tax=Brevundimonas sp. TaxID=1871086 RepID=UPI003919D0C4